MSDVLICITSKDLAEALKAADGLMDESLAKMKVSELGNHTSGMMRDLIKLDEFVSDILKKAKREEDGYKEFLEFLKQFGEPINIEVE